MDENALHITDSYTESNTKSNHESNYESNTDSYNVSNTSTKRYTITNISAREVDVLLNFDALSHTNKTLDSFQEEPVFSRQDTLCSVIGQSDNSDTKERERDSTNASDSSGSQLEQFAETDGWQFLAESHPKDLLEVPSHKNRSSLSPSISSDGGDYIHMVTDYASTQVSPSQSVQNVAELTLTDSSQDDSKSTISMSSSSRASEYDLKTPEPNDFLDVPPSFRELFLVDNIRSHLSGSTCSSSESDESGAEDQINHSFTVTPRGFNAQCNQTNDEEINTRDIPIDLLQELQDAVVCGLPDLTSNSDQISPVLSPIHSPKRPKLSTSWSILDNDGDDQESGSAYLSQKVCVINMHEETDTDCLSVISELTEPENELSPDLTKAPNSDAVSLDTTPDIIRAVNYTNIYSKPSTLEEFDEAALYEAVLGSSIAKTRRDQHTHRHNQVKSWADVFVANIIGEAIKYCNRNLLNSPGSPDTFNKLVEQELEISDYEDIDLAMLVATNKSDLISKEIHTTQKLPNTDLFHQDSRNLMVEEKEARSKVTSVDKTYSISPGLMKPKENMSLGLVNQRDNSLYMTSREKICEMSPSDRNKSELLRRDTITELAEAQSAIEYLDATYTEHSLTSLCDEELMYQDNHNVKISRIPKIGRCDTITELAEEQQKYIKENIKHNIKNPWLKPIVTHVANKYENNNFQSQPSVLRNQLRENNTCNLYQRRDTITEMALSEELLCNQDNRIDTMLMISDKELNYQMDTGIVVHQDSRRDTISGKSLSQEHCRQDFGLGLQHTSPESDEINVAHTEGSRHELLRNTSNRKPKKQERIDTITEMAYLEKQTKENMYCLPRAHIDRRDTITSMSETELQYRKINGLSKAKQDHGRCHTITELALSEQYIMNMENLGKQDYVDHIIDLAEVHGSRSDLSVNADHYKTGDTLTESDAVSEGKNLFEDKYLECLTLPDCLANVSYTPSSVFSDTISNSSYHGINLDDLVLSIKGNNNIHAAAGPERRDTLTILAEQQQLNDDVRLDLSKLFERNVSETENNKLHCVVDSTNEYISTSPEDNINETDSMEEQNRKQSAVLAKIAMLEEARRSDTSPRKTRTLSHMRKSKSKQSYKEPVLGEIDSSPISSVSDLQKVFDNPPLFLQTPHLSPRSTNENVLKFDGHNNSNILESCDQREEKATQTSLMQENVTFEYINDSMKNKDYKSNDLHNRKLNECENANLLQCTKEHDMIGMQEQKYINKKDKDVEILLNAHYVKLSTDTLSCDDPLDILERSIHEIRDDDYDSIDELLLGNSPAISSTQLCHARESFSTSQQANVLNDSDLQSMNVMTNTTEPFTSTMNNRIDDVRIASKETIGELDYTIEDTYQALDSGNIATAKVLFLMHYKRYS